MTTPIHVLCSNFTEIVRQEVGETMHCIADKNNRKMRFGAILRRFGGGRQNLQVSVPRDPVFPVKFHPNRFRFAEVIPEKVFLYEYRI